MSRGRRWIFGFWLVIVPGRHLVQSLADDPALLLALFALAAFVAIVWYGYRRDRRDPPADVTFLRDRPETPLPLRAGARCLVCRSDLSGAVIYCASCHTPHHAECFQWAGACSVYACRGREFRRAA